MHWVYLVLAIIFEVCGTSCLKLLATKPGLLLTIATAGFYSISFILLGMSLRKIEVSIAYAIWAGMGTALIVIIGILVFHETISWIKMLLLTTLVFSVVGLKMISA